MKYLSSGAFRRALEERLRTHSLQSGVPLIRLRKMVAFDRFLTRLLHIQPGVWVVKGGLALQLRLGDRARTTKDIDILALSRPEEIMRQLREAGSCDLNDWFTFEVSEPAQNAATDRLYLRHWRRQGGLRHPIHALLDGRTFEHFHIDIGIGDPMLEAVEYFDTPALLEFAELAPTHVPCFPITQQIAEKLHAYTRPRKSGESSRVKDFVDMLLLSEMRTISGERLFQAIQATFSARATHALPVSVPPPPAKWESEFKRMAKDVGMDKLSLVQAYGSVQQFLDPVLKGEISKEWDVAAKLWR
jgi:hypothetical protein